MACGVNDDSKPSVVACEPGRLSRPDARPCCTRSSSNTRRRSIVTGRRESARGRESVHQRAGTCRVALTHTHPSPHRDINHYQTTLTDVAAESERSVNKHWRNRGESERAEVERESSTHRGRDGWMGELDGSMNARERRRCRLCAFEHKAAGPPLLSSSSLPTARREITTRSLSATQEYEYSCLSCGGGGLSQIYRRTRPPGG